MSFNKSILLLLSLLLLSLLLLSLLLLSTPPPLVVNVLLLVVVNCSPLRWFCRARRRPVDNVQSAGGGRSTSFNKSILYCCPCCCYCRPCPPSCRLHLLCKLYLYTTPPQVPTKQKFPQAEIANDVALAGCGGRFFITLIFHPDFRSTGIPVYDPRSVLHTYANAMA